MDLARRTLLQQREPSVLAMLVKIGVQLAFVVRIKHSKIEFRNIWIDRVSRTFQHDGEAERGNHVRNLSAVFKLKLARARYSQPAGQLEIQSLVEYLPKRTLARHCDLAESAKRLAMLIEHCLLYTSDA